jgi:hypothetical protein
VDRAKDFMSPPVEIPGGADVEGVPGASNQGRGAVVIVAEFELAARGIEVADKFRIGRLLDDVEGEEAVGFEFRDLFFKDGIAAKFAGAICADEIPSVGGAGWIRKANFE